MTAHPSRWFRIEALVTSVLERPPAERRGFLVEATAGEDADLVAEVAALVTHATRDPTFLDRIADRLVAPVLAEALAEVGPPASEEVPVGEMLAGRYRIEGRAGVGGMGEVYRATDTRLDRVVALKLLPTRIGADPEARRRFMQEARAASALDHPHIATVHDILELPGGRHCIVMAHYEGRTLAEMLRTGPMHPDVLLDVAIQVARGLEAAHGQGIVHCDVKPDNVLVSEAGPVKIVDFGLARFVTPGHPGTAPPRGTLPYMAPEQLRGGDVRPATDVWALGVTLFEAATGRRPFDGDDGTAVVRAILAAEPPRPSETDPELPGWLDELVDGALRPDPAERPADAGVVLQALEEVRAAAEVAAGSAGHAEGRGPRRGLLAAGTAGLAVVAVIAASELTGDGDPVRFTRPRQLSAAQGVEDFAAWSPGGDAVLYQGAAGGEVFGGSADVFLRELDGEVSRSLTADHGGFDGWPSWSPDGTRMAWYSARDGGGYFVRDVAGGPPRKIWSGTPLGGAHNPAVWSPDGTELGITVDGDADGARLEILSATDGTPRHSVPLPGRPGNLLFGAARSPDGRFLALSDAMNLTPDEARLWVVRLDDGVAVPVTEGRDLAWSPSWGPRGRTLYYVSDRGGGRDLWAQALGSDGRPRGTPREVTTGIGMRNAALSRDGTRLVYSQGRIVAHVWRVPLPAEGLVSWDRAEQVTSDRAYVEFVEVDPVAGDVYVSSDRGGNQDLWRFDAEGGPPERLTSDPASDWAPMLSPDGTRLAWYSARSGNRDVWVRSLEDGTTTRVTRHEGIDFVPSWAPDGRRLVFASGRSGNLDVWTVDLEGGAPRQLTTDPAMDAWPHWSPDGSTIVFRSNRDGGWRLWSVPAEGGRPTPVTRTATTYFRWSEDGSALYLVSGGQLWRHDLATREERPLTGLERRQGTPGVVALAADHRHLYFTWEEDVGDLWMMERAR